MIISCTRKVTQLTLENTRKRCETSSKLTIKIPSVSIVDFEQVIANWEISPRKVLLQKISPIIMARKP